MRDLWRPGGGTARLTWRRLGVLLDGLPPESATKTAQANDLGEEQLAELAKRDRDGFGPFSNTDMLVASLVDAVNRNTYMLQLVNTDAKKRRQVKAPEPVYRPGVVRRRRPRATEESARLLAHMRANQGAAPSGWKDTTGPPNWG